MQNSCWDLALVLVNCGTDMHAKYDGRTPLLSALEICTKNALDEDTYDVFITVISLMVQKGADVHAVSDDGETCKTLLTALVNDLVYMDDPVEMAQAMQCMRHIAEVVD
jgi:hypothetical protein